MKYLKSLKEELSPDTYLRAAEKLKKIGQNKRHDELLNWSKKIKLDEIIKKVSKFGEFRFILNNTSDQSFEGDFYLSIYFDLENQILSIEDMIDDKYISLKFEIALIPKYSDLNEIQNIMPNIDNCISDIGYIVGSINVDFELIDNNIKFKSMDINDDDYNFYGTLEIGDRRTAGKLKRLLYKALSNKEYYPSFDDNYKSLYDKVNKQLGSYLTTDYNFTPEKLAEFINSISANSLFIK